MRDGDIFIISTYLFIGMAIIIYDIARIKRIPIDFMRLFNVFFLISYIISPIFHIILFSQLQDELYIINGITLYRSTPSMPIIIATAYLSIVIGYQITSSTASLQIAVNERMRYNIHIIILFFMIFLMLIYTSNFGGIIPWIKSSISARMSRIETENAGGSFFLIYNISAGRHSYIICRICISHS